MAAAPRAIPEFRGLDAVAIRRDLLDGKQPAVLRGLVADWPAVRAGNESATTFLRYLVAFDTGAPVDALLMAPECQGRIAYNQSMSGFNFIRNRLPLSQVAAQALRYAQSPKAPSVAVQSALIRDCAPGFAAENRLNLLDASVAPRLWLGNRVTTPAHVDEWDNIGCVVAGRRRFTLFPPEQISNLYIGPIDFAPTGAPMSLASLDAPDFLRFPKLRDALAAAQVAILQPGDAIVIPPLWWHHVESLDPFNAFVNYWWQDRRLTRTATDSAFDVLLHGILGIRDLPPATRKAWAALFEHYVFAAEAQDLAHIPPERYGVLGDLSAEKMAGLRAQLAQRLKDPPTPS